MTILIFLMQDTKAHRSKLRRRIQYDTLCLQPSFFQWQLQQRLHIIHVSWILILHDLHFSYFTTSISQIFMYTHNNTTNVKC